MIKKIFTTLLLGILLQSCVNERDLSQNTVIAHILSQPDGLHPFNDNAAMRTFIFQYTQKTLIKLDMESLEYIPTLVKEMPIASDDNLSFSYELKDGILWDDGSSFTAEDVAFSVKLMLCPLTNNAQIRSNYTTVIESIELDSTNNKISQSDLKKNYLNKIIYHILNFEKHIIARTNLPIGSSIIIIAKKK